MLRSSVYQIVLPPGAEIREANDPTQENERWQTLGGVNSTFVDEHVPFHDILSCLSLPQCNPATLAYFSSSQLRVRHIIIPLKQRMHMAEEGERERA